MSIEYNEAFIYRIFEHTLIIACMCTVCTVLTVHSAWSLDGRASTFVSFSDPLYEVAGNFSL